MSRHPEVKWAQRLDKVYVTVQLPDAKDVKVNLEPDGIFTFAGTAGSGNNLYELKLDLFDKVNVEESKINTGVRSIFCVIEKAEKGWWKKLLRCDEKTPHYIKVDWEKWEDEDDGGALGGDNLDLGGMDFSNFGGTRSDGLDDVLDDIDDEGQEVDKPQNADLPTEFLVEIFVRLMSASSLFRCAVVCKMWHRLILSPTLFFRRYSFFPLPLGIFSDSKAFIPATSFPALQHLNFSFIPSYCEGSTIIGCRNGLVVLLNNRRNFMKDKRLEIVVCNPLSQEWTSLPPIATGGHLFSESAVLLTDIDDDDRSPSSSAFRVLIRLSSPFIDASEWVLKLKIIFISFSSAADGGWGPEIRFEVPHKQVPRIRDYENLVVIRGIIYWLGYRDLHCIVALRLDAYEFYRIELPAEIVISDQIVRGHIARTWLIASTEQKTLSFLVLHGFSLFIWNHSCHDANGAESFWVMEEEIDLEINLRELQAEDMNDDFLLQFCGFAERSGTVLLETLTAFFSFNLRTRRLEKFAQRSDYIAAPYPYEIEWPPSRMRVGPEQEVDKPHNAEKTEEAPSDAKKEAAPST